MGHIGRDGYAIPPATKNSQMAAPLIPQPATAPNPPQSSALFHHDVFFSPPPPPPPLAEAEAEAVEEAPEASFPAPLEAPPPPSDRSLREGRRRGRDLCRAEEERDWERARRRRGPAAALAARVPRTENIGAAAAAAAGGGWGGAVRGRCDVCAMGTERGLCLYRRGADGAEGMCVCRSASRRGKRGALWGTRVCKICLFGIYLASRRPNVGIRNSIIRTEDGEGERSAWGVRRGRTRAVRYILRLYIQYMMHDTLSISHPISKVPGGWLLSAIYLLSSKFA